MRRGMKKVIYIILCSALCANFFLFCGNPASVYADSSVKMIGTTANLLNVTGDYNPKDGYYYYSDVKITEIKGFGGVSPEETAVQMTKTGNNAYFQTVWKNDNFEGDFVIDFEVFLGGGIRSLRVATNSSLDIVERIDANKLGISNQWARVTVVFHAATGKSDAYLNGRGLSGNIDTLLHKDGRNLIRFIPEGDVDASLYMGRLSMYEIDAVPRLTAPPNPCGVLGRLELPQGSTAADVAAALPQMQSIRIFTDESYIEEVADAPLEDGYWIVADDGKNHCVYRVCVDNGVRTEASMRGGELAFLRARTTQEKGLFGKATADVSRRVTLTSSLPGFSDYTLLSDVTQGYVRIDFNLEPGTAEKIYIGTNLNYPLSPPLALIKNRWNFVTIIYDVESYNVQTGVGMANVYVNGEMIAQTETIFTTYGQIRLVIEGKAGCYAFVDDFTVYTYREDYPDFPAPDKVNTLPTDGDSIFLIEDNLNTSIFQPLQNVKIRIYRDDKFSSLLPASEEPAVGNAVVIENEKTGFCTYYILRDFRDSPENTIFVYGDAVKDGQFTDGTLNVAVSVKQLEPLPQIVVAAYQEERFLRSSITEPIQTGTLITEFETSDEAEIVKIMILEHGTLQPLVKVYEVVRESNGG